MTAAKRVFDVSFVEPLDEKFTCPICHLAFREPTLTRCGHHFCSSCLTQCLQQSASCPVCRMPLEESNTFPNNALKREILDLKIKCCLHEKGCAWTGELRDGEMHDRECQYVDVTCVNGCEQLVMQINMNNHVANECPQRLISCKHCNIIVKQVEMEDHYEECDQYPIDCTYKCGMMVQKCRMERHIGRQGTCTKILLDCDFKDNGCQFQGYRHDLYKHVENNIGLHLSLIASALKETKEKSAANELKLEHELNIATRELKATKDELTKTRKELRETKDELEKTTKEELEKTRKELTEATAKISRESHRRCLSLLPQISEKFLFTWTINNWHEKMRALNNYALFSNPFYVPPGYHLYLKAYPNGGNAYSRGYLGLYLFSTEGDFDNEVKWPFPFSCDFELVDQQVDRRRSICMEISPPYPPLHDGYGYREIVSHDRLKSRCYIKNNAICIKLHVYLDYD
ncbi:TNF receptor-associated factor 6-like [Corticium candelabrum]|uniref:TNF receptor-associated factor 6-like n=1 Tax=Corticium candelabrum TaxID=121492 RepID=UPI002E26BB3A|nr:TNF receptor-associated factor 6-like [Corticium candelabrum]